MAVHDHFSGSANCRECEGPCRLTGEELSLTKLVRWTMEFSEKVHDGWMWDLTSDALKELLGIDRFRQFKQRAKE